MKLLMLLILLVLPVSAGAATYSWTDKSGTINFSDDLGSVPKQFRKKVRIIDDGTPEAAAPEQTQPVKTEEKPAPAGTGTGDKPAAPASPSAGNSSQYGGRTAQEWQTEFSGLRAQLKAQEGQLEQLKAESGDGKKFLTNEQIADINSRNKQLNQEYESTRTRFNQLVDQANKAGLPSEFAQ